MIGYFIFGFFALIFSLVASFKNDKKYLFFSFICIFLFQAIRYKYGNDYDSYNEIFKEINSGNEFLFINKTNYEFGWVIINKLFYYLGFKSLIAAVSLFVSYVFYRFITLYVKPQFYWIAIFLFFFDSNFLLLYITAIRQSIALAIFLLSMIVYERSKKHSAFLLLFLAPFFHTSSLIIIPIVLFIFYLKRLSMIILQYKLFLTGLFILFFFLADYFKEYINLINVVLLNNRYYEYTISLDKKNSVSIFNISFYAFLFFMVISYSKNFFQNKLYLFYFTLIGLIFIPFALAIPLVARLSYYFLPFLIIVVPIIFSLIKNSLKKTVFLSIIILITLVRLFKFFNSETYQSGFYYYHTIFDKWI